MKIINNLKVNSVRSKLILSGVINILIILSIAGFAVYLTSRVKQLANTTVVAGLNAVTANSIADRRMNSLVQRIDKLTNYFIFSPDQFREEADKILTELKILRAESSSRDRRFNENFQLIEQSLTKVFTEADKILSYVKWTGEDIANISQLFDAMQEYIFNETAHYVMLDQKFRLWPLEKASATLTSFRVDLLKVDHAFNELYKVMLVRDQYDKQKKELARLGEVFGKSIFSAAPAGEKHIAYLNTLKDYYARVRDNIAVIDASSKRFYEAFNELHKNKEDFFALSAEVEKNIGEEASSMVIWLVRSLSIAQNVILSISVMGIVSILIFSIWQIFSILTPINKVVNKFTKISKEISAGKAERVELFAREGDKEIAKLVESINVFISTLSLDQRRLTDYQTALTELKEAQTQLIQSEKMAATGRLVAGVAHDFNNILTSILNLSEIIQFELPPDSSLQADIKMVIEAAKHAAELTQQLLAFSRKQVIELKPVNVSQLVAEMDKMMATVVREDIHIKIATHHSIWLANLDANQIKRVIINILVNASDAITGEGMIFIETANVSIDEIFIRKHKDFIPGDYVMLSISDTGTGMPANIKEHIFEPFFTTKGPGKGSGLGLSSTYGIVKQHDGHINVYSEIGKGSTFKIYFHAMHTDDKPPVQETLSLSQFKGSETILLIDDDKLIREATAIMLRRSGYAVFIADNAEHAYKICDEHQGQIDLVLCDVILPNIGGKAICQRIENRRPKIKVLFMSGYPDEIISYQGVLNKGVNFIQKPFNGYTLGKKIREVLGK